MVEGQVERVKWQHLRGAKQPLAKLMGASSVLAQVVYAEHSTQQLDMSRPGLTMPLPALLGTSPLAADSMPMDRAVPLGATERRLSGAAPMLRRLSISCDRVGVLGPLPVLMRRALVTGDPLSTSPAHHMTCTAQYSSVKPTCFLYHMCAVRLKCAVMCITCELPFVRRKTLENCGPFTRCPADAATSESMAASVELC